MPDLDPAHALSGGTTLGQPTIKLLYRSCGPVDFVSGGMTLGQPRQYLPAPKSYVSGQIFRGYETNSTPNSEIALPHAQHPKTKYISMYSTSSYRESFEKKLAGLNAEQQQAVRTIEGPVMVIAGPGTGKTTMLSYRIGHILLQTDTPPENILCLTYTDAAAAEMRNRLIEYIGPEAYKIQVNTFHGFCNLVIQENPASFSHVRELEPIAELDKFRVLQKMIDSFSDDHPLKRFKGQKYFDWKKLLNLFNLMKEENWTSEGMLQQIHAYIERARNSENYIYKRKSGEFAKGDFNEGKFRKEILDKMIPLQAAVREFDHYNHILADTGRYDFQDMLQWVNGAFARDANLLADYQERFLYVLVDEFQDTNGIQMAILQKLIDHEWLDQPNVFVVGDDDQAIYRFQGANVENLLAFHEKYRPEVIALKQNYRSSQLIVDTARTIMFPVSLGLMQKVFGQTKELVAAGKNKDHDRPVHIADYPTVSNENADIFRRLRAWHESGSEDTIAVLYPKHALGQELAQALKGAGIPFTTRLRQDILQLPLTGHILDILTALDELAMGAPIDDSRLYRILHLEYLGLPVADLQRIIIAYTATPYAERMNLFVWLQQPKRLDELRLNNPTAIADAVSLFDKGARNYHTKTLQAMVEWVVNAFGILGWIMRQEEKIEILSALKTLFTFVEEQAAGHDSFSAPELLELCGTMREYNISLPAAELGADRKRSVILSTLHGVKGLEYDRVIIKNLTASEWEEKRANPQQFTLPDNLVANVHPMPEDADNSNEQDLRRLLYVGMTRARRQLTLTHAVANDNGRSMTQSKFLTELLQHREEIVRETLTAEDVGLAEYLYAFMRGEQQADLELDHEEIRKRVREHVLNPSGLNAYLECPLGFYYDKILRIPSITAPHMIFGQALHYALEQYFINRFAKGDTMVSREFLLEGYERFMYGKRHQFSPKDYQDRLTYGRNALTQFFDSYSSTWSSDADYKTEYRIDNIHIAGVPVKGFIDRVDKLGDRITVSDYKSGKLEQSIAKKAAAPSKENPEGGSYWRQVVFYDLMLEADPKYRRHFDVGIIQGLEPGKDGRFVRREIQVTEADREVLRNLISDTHAKIQAMEFYRGCGDCAWCRMHGISPALPDDGEAESA